MRAAGQNPLLAAQRGINLHAVYALAWGLSTLTGSLAGMLIALDSGLTNTMVIIGLKAFPAALVGGLDSLAGALIGALIIGAAEVLSIQYIDPLLSDVVPFLVLIVDAGDRALGPVRHARGARPCLAEPARQRLFPHRLRAGDRADADATGARQSGRLHRRAAGLSVHRLRVLSRSRLPGVPRLDRRAVADAAHRLCRTGFARPCRPAVGRRLHRRHPVPRVQRAVLGHAAGRGGQSARCSA